MRFNQFLPEASIFTGSYTYGHKVNVAVNNKNMGQKILNAIQDTIPGFEGSEDLEWIRPVTKTSTPDKKLHLIVVGRGDDRKFFKLPDGRVIVIMGTEKSIQGGLTHAKGEKGSTAENAGDASEPVLSAAVVAKLIKRGQDSVDDIDEDDVKKVLAAAVKTPDLSYEVNDKNSKIADTIKFTIMVKKPTLDFLSDPEFWNSKMGAILPSVVHYANSGQMDRYADFFYKNGKVDMIHVKSDGVSEATERKTDVEASVNGRPLKGMNVSLKAGSPHIGQVGAGSLKDPFSDEKLDPKTGKMKGRLGIWTASNKLFSPFGISIPKPEGPVTSKVLYWKAAYIEAANQLEEMLAGADARSEAGIVAKIANFVSNHGTKGDPNIKLVNLGAKGVSSVHSFKNLYQKLAANNIDLTCKYREGKSKLKGDPRPELRVFDKNSDRDLMFIRYSSTELEDKIWNTVEMKDLLKELTTLTYTRTERDNDRDPLSREVKLPDTTPAPAATATTPTSTGHSWTPPTAKAPAFAAPAMAGKSVNTLQGSEWKSADDLENKFDNRHDVGVAEETIDKDVSRLKKLAGIRDYMSKGV
jgi:hypothetical protein